MAPVVDAVVVVFAFVLGLLVGSFLNVVLWRVPRGESVVHPGSHCPSCNTPLEWYELVPLVSWVFPRGRCRTSGVGISVRYQLAELGCGVLLGASAWLALS
jgi:prepilin signal peptidase PulO-like enzyme (type II secretory pathway)